LSQPPGGASSKAFIPAAFRDDNQTARTTGAPAPGNTLDPSMNICRTAAPLVVRKQPRWGFESVSTILFLLAVATPAAAQLGGLPRPEAPAAPAPVVDLLGRQTPRGTIAGFTSAVHRKDFTSAAAYMQLTPSQMQDAPELARDLSALLDRYFTDPVTALSLSPTGMLEDGLPLDRDRLRLSIDDQKVDLLLVRVTDPQNGPIWLISSDAIAEVPSLRNSLEASWIDRSMPQTLVTHTLFHVSFAQWLFWLASIAGPVLLMRLVVGLVGRLVKNYIDHSTGRLHTDAWIDRLAWPSVLVLALAIHMMVMRLLGFSLTFRLTYVRWPLICFAVAFGWLLWRLLALSFAEAAAIAERRGQSGTRSLMLLGERVVKVVVVLATVFALLTIAGVDTTTALAGVGLGGVALALGAQKSVENLLGGVFLLSDRALAVGDFCSISDRSGWIEDITLRSVRLRTLEQSLLSIPAGSLSQASIENFATRQKILMQNMLRLRYGASVGQLQSILDGIRGLLSEHPQIDRDSARIRLVNFGANAVELELFAYVKTSDFSAFLAVRESVLLAAAAIVESAGATFARPTELVTVAPPPAGISGQQAPAGPVTSKR
jgi:MscS family membrane protein